MFLLSIGYSSEQIKLLAVRHGSYQDEKRTRVAFDFSGGLPNFIQDIDSEAVAVHILFENVAPGKVEMKIYPIQDGRVDNVSIRATERGIEAVILTQTPFTLTNGKIQNNNTVVYFDIKENQFPGTTPSVSPKTQLNTGKISGRVFDNLTGKALPGVQITILELKVMTTSDGSGTYIISDIPTGSMTLKFSHPGYIDEFRTISISGMKEANLNIALNRTEARPSPAPTSEPFSSSPPSDRFQNQKALEFFQLGEYHFQSNHFREAIEAYQKALEYDPEFSDAYYKLGISYGKSGEPESGINVLREAIRLNPQNAKAYNALGAIYGMLQQYGNAIDFFKKAVEVNPQFDLVYNNLGILYGKTGEHKKAIEALGHAIQINPHSAETYGALGVAYAMAGQPQEAIEPLLEAIRIDPSYAKAYFNLGITYVWLGDLRRAREQYEKLQDLNQFMAQDLLEELGKIDN